MRIRTIAVLAALAAAVISLPAPAPLRSVPSALAAPKQAVCIVCQVKNGSTEPEPVKATRTHGGVEYAFCNENCAKEFDADPAAFVPSEFPYAPPAFALTDLQGKPVSNESLRGKVVLLDFWATWCAPCRKAIPDLNALQGTYGDRGFTVVGISLDEGGDAAKKVKRFVTSQKIRYPVALDAGQDPVYEAFKVKAVPAAFLLDREGRVVAKWTGAPAHKGEVEAKLETLLKPAD